LWRTQVSIQYSTHVRKPRRGPGAPSGRSGGIRQVLFSIARGRYSAVFGFEPHANPTLCDKFSPRPPLLIARARGHAVGVERGGAGEGEAPRHAFPVRPPARPPPHLLGLKHSPCRRRLDVCCRSLRTTRLWPSPMTLRGASAANPANRLRTLRGPPETLRRQ